MIKAVIYDLDDTLYPESAFRESGFKYLAEQLLLKGYSVSKEAIEAVYAENSKGTFDALVEKFKLSITAEDLVTLYREHPPHIAPYPGVIVVLEALQKKYTLGIITDHIAVQQKNKVSALGIEQYFSHIIYSDELGTMKPDVALFEKMKQLTGAGMGEIVYVADNEKKDFIGARAAGYITVKYKNKGGGVYADVDAEPAYKADFEITSHDEIFSIIS